MSSLKILKDDWVIESIDWDWERAVVTPKGEVVIQSGAEHTNEGDEPSTGSISLTQSISEQSAVKWENSLMTGLTVELEKEAGFPKIGAAKLTTSLTIQNTFTKGGKKVTTDLNEAQQSSGFTVPPKSIVRCDATLLQQDIRIPFTTTMRSVKDRSQKRTEKGEMSALMGQEVVFKVVKIRDL